MEVDLERCCQIRVADRTSLLARTHITDLVAIIGAHEDWHIEMPVWRADESAASRVPSPSHAEAYRSAESASAARVREAGDRKAAE